MKYSLLITFIVTLLFGACSIIDSDDPPQADTYSVAGLTDSLEVRYYGAADWGQDWYNWKGETDNETLLTTPETSQSLTFQAGGVSNPQIVIVNRKSTPVEVSAIILSGDNEIARGSNTLATGKALLVR